MAKLWTRASDMAGAPWYVTQSKRCRADRIAGVKDGSWLHLRPGRTRAANRAATSASVRALTNRRTARIKGLTGPSSPVRLGSAPLRSGTWPAVAHRTPDPSAPPGTRPHTTPRMIGQRRADGNAKVLTISAKAARLLGAAVSDGDGAGRGADHKRRYPPSSGCPRAGRTGADRQIWCVTRQARCCVARRRKGT
jgi:hypothetical protein